jgi:hypothetical protein
VRKALFVVLVLACVPEGNSTPSDAGVAPGQPSSAAFRPSVNIMTTVFEDNFDRTSKPMVSAPATGSSAPTTGSSVPPMNLPVPPTMASLVPSASAAPSNSGPLAPLLPASAQAQVPDDLGPNWRQAATAAWHIENGRLCGEHAKNHGVWLNKVLPVNARIEFTAYAESQEGDLKAEFWGDGQSHATAISYTNATSYLAILGGWKNKYHVLAKQNEHGSDRKQIVIDPASDDPKEKPVVAGQGYRFTIERTDGHTVRWYLNNDELLTYDDPTPLAGMGHDHFGFNDFDVKVCFDSVKVTPLP